MARRESDTRKSRIGTEVPSTKNRSDIRDCKSRRSTSRRRSGELRQGIRNRSGRMNSRSGKSITLYHPTNISTHVKVLGGLRATELPQDNETIPITMIGVDCLSPSRRDNDRRIVRIESSDNKITTDRTSRIRNRYRRARPFRNGRSTRKGGQNGRVRLTPVNLLCSRVEIPVSKSAERSSRNANTRSPNGNLPGNHLDLRDGAVRDFRGRNTTVRELRGRNSHISNLRGRNRKIGKVRCDNRTVNNLRSRNRCVGKLCSSNSRVRKLRGRNGPILNGRAADCLCRPHILGVNGTSLENCRSLGATQRLFPNRYLVNTATNMVVTQIVYLPATDAKASPAAITLRPSHGLSTSRLINQSQVDIEPTTITVSPKLLQRDHEVVPTLRNEAELRGMKNSARGHILNLTALWVNTNRPTRVRPTAKGAIVSTDDRLRPNGRGRVW